MSEFWLFAPRQIEQVRAVGATGRRIIVDLRAMIAKSNSEQDDLISTLNETQGDLGIAVTVRWPDWGGATPSDDAPTPRTDKAPSAREARAAERFIESVAMRLVLPPRVIFNCYNEPAVGPGRITTIDDLYGMADFQKDAIAAVRDGWGGSNPASSYPQKRQVASPSFARLGSGSRVVEAIRSILLASAIEAGIDLVDVHLNCESGGDAEARIDEAVVALQGADIGLISTEAGCAQYPYPDNIAGAVHELYDIASACQRDDLELICYNPWHPQPNAGHGQFVWSAACEPNGDPLEPFWSACQRIARRA